jgi:hypothetical protein
LKQTIRGLLVVLSLLIVSCSNYKTTNGFVTKKNVGQLLTRLEKGYSFKNQPVTGHMLLDDLKEYITAEKERLYKNKDPKQYDYDMALIELFRSDFFNGFHDMHKLVDNQNYRALVLYHIGRIINAQNYDHSADFVLGLSALATRDTFPAPLVVDQQVSLLAFCSFYPVLQMTPYLTNEILDRRELEGDNYRYRIERVKHPERLEEMDLRKRFFVWDIPESFIGDLIKKYHGEEFTYDYAVTYYIHPYHQDFAKAKYYADKLDYKKWIKIYPYDRIEELMRAYIGAGDYKKAIEIYNYHANHFDTDSQSLCHSNLLLGAAYAGLGDLNTSFDYVSKEFAITEVKDPEKKFNKAQPYDTKGDMLVSLYELFFVFDEYKKYEGTKWFDRLEEMVNRNLARYKHLRVFNRR